MRCQMDAFCISLTNHMLHHGRPDPKLLSSKPIRHLQTRDVDVIRVCVHPVAINAAGKLPIQESMNSADPNVATKLKWTMLGLDDGRLGVQPAQHHVPTFIDLCSELFRQQTRTHPVQLDQPHLAPDSCYLLVWVG